MRQHRLEPDKPGSLVNRGRLQGGDFMLAQCFTDNVEPIRQGGIAEDLLAAPLPSGRMVATIDFSGLMSSTCARASAAARLPIDSLDCCTAILGIQEFKGDSAGFGALGAHAISDCLLRVLRHEAFQFSLGALVFEKCRVS